MTICIYELKSKKKAFSRSKLIFQFTEQNLILTCLFGIVMLRKREKKKEKKLLRNEQKVFIGKYNYDIFLKSIN